MMHEVDYNSRTPYVSSYFYCQIRSEELLYDAERDLLAIAKFLVKHSNDRDQFYPWRTTHAGS